MFKGSLPALVTPFAEDGSLDEATFAAFVEWQIGEGSHGLVPVGTTGESPTLTHGEHKRIVEICIISPGSISTLGVVEYDFTLPPNLPQGMYFLGQATVVHQGTTFRTASQVVLIH